MSLVTEVILWGIWLSLSRRKHFGELAQCFHCRGRGFNAWSENPHAGHYCGPKRRKRRREKEVQTIKAHCATHHTTLPEDCSGLTLGQGVRLAATWKPLGTSWPLPLVQAGEPAVRTPAHTPSRAHRPDPQLVASSRDTADCGCPGNPPAARFCSHAAPTPWPRPGRAAKCTGPAQLPAPASLLPSHMAPRSAVLALPCTTARAHAPTRACTSPGPISHWSASLPPGSHQASPWHCILRLRVGASRQLKLWRPPWVPTTVHGALCALGRLLCPCNSPMR